MCLMDEYFILSFGLPAVEYQIFVTMVQMDVLHYMVRHQTRESKIERRLTITEIIFIMGINKKFIFYTNHEFMMTLVKL